MATTTKQTLAKVVDPSTVKITKAQFGQAFNGPRRKLPCRFAPAGSGLRVARDSPVRGRLVWGHSSGAVYRVPHCPRGPGHVMVSPGWVPGGGSAPHVGHLICWSASRPSLSHGGHGGW